MFCPGETIIHQFDIPFATENVSKVLITYKQDDDAILDKYITSRSAFTDLGHARTRVTVTLTQEESLLFQENKNYTIQLNVMSGTNGNVRTSSKIIKDYNGPQYYKEVISNA